MTDDPLQNSVQFVQGVGPQRAELLAKLQLRTVDELLCHLPRDILDLTDVRPPSQLEEGLVQTVSGTVVDVDGRRLSGGRSISAVLLDCNGEYARGSWFNQTWPQQKFQHGQPVLFSGKPKRKGGRWEFSHPRVQWLDADDGEAHAGILTRYGLTEGLKMYQMRRMMRHAVEQYAEFVPEHLPAAFREQHQLLTRPEAFRQVHLPADMDEYRAGRRRLIYDDLLEFQLALAIRRRAWKQQDVAPVLKTSAKIDARIRRLFPFEFTDGQNRAVREIADDLASGKAMHRLLQADVGAGKTVVAVYTMLVAIAAGYQVALMAPTEVLAVQHWETINSALAHSRVKRVLLTGQLTAAQRKKTLADIKSGEAQLVIGTQAVIQKDVEFQRLGVVVIDEQHKFGVEQRARFSAGESSPHILVMTATPIPRSLCLTQFGDLDITAIRDLPPGRQRVVTSRITGQAGRAKAWGFLRKQLQTGRQAFVVCPRVVADETESDHELAASAETVHQQLSAGELKDFRVDLVHGQMDRDRKLAAMERFREGDTQVLVATTVVEVGVDVPNATLMAIYQAERFGLSQLHQLRGRISRGRFQGYCFLFSDSDAADAVQRLSAMEETADGFKIAETDFELRGPGDVLGTRQHGDLPLRVADLIRDNDVLVEAREAAFDLVKSGEFDQPEFAPLKILVLERFRQLMDLPQNG
jgi:ATP-dependent DNA helicase RecG